MSRLAVFAVTLAAAASPAAAETRFLQAFEDVPLAPGLSEDGGSLLSFPTAEGRIVDITATGEASSAEVAQFYQNSLPALGWSPAPGAFGLQFFRGRERLDLRIDEEAPGRVAARFRLVSTQAPAILD